MFRPQNKQEIWKWYLLNFFSSKYLDKSKIEIFFDKICFWLLKYKSMFMKNVFS